MSVAKCSFNQTKANRQGLVTPIGRQLAVLQVPAALVIVLHQLQRVVVVRLVEGSDAETLGVSPAKDAKFRREAAAATAATATGLGLSSLLQHSDGLHLLIARVQKNESNVPFGGQFRPLEGLAHHNLLDSETFVRAMRAALLDPEYHPVAARHLLLELLLPFEVVAQPVEIHVVVEAMRRSQHAPGAIR